MGDMSVHFSSATDMWATPQAFFDELDREFHFEVDVCAIAENAKCERFFSPEVDGLAQPWSGVCWMNPPYGRTIGAWVKKAYESGKDGATVVCLLPARTDTSWWHNYVRTFDWATRTHVMHADEVREIRGRLRFGDAKHSAPFPSTLVIFRPKAK